MRILTKEPLVRCYQVLHEAGCQGEDSGLTASDLAGRCDQRYGARHQGYWGKQLQALAEMGYAEKSGRCSIARRFGSLWHPTSSSEGVPRCSPSHYPTAPTGILRMSRR